MKTTNSTGNDKAKRLLGLKNLGAAAGGAALAAIFLLGAPREPFAAPGSPLYLRVTQKALLDLKETGQTGAGRTNATRRAAAHSPGPKALLRDYYYCPQCQIYHPRRPQSRTSSPPSSPPAGSAPATAHPTNTASSPPSP